MDKKAFSLFGRKFILTAILWQLSIAAFSQFIQNEKYVIRTEGDSKIYVINYDLVSPFDNVACQVKVKLSAQQGYQTFYLKNVTGDVGRLIYPGLNKQIIWDHVAELVHFSGDINLTIEVEPVISVSAKVKAGKQLSVNIGPEISAGKTYGIKLFRKGKEVATLKEGSLNETSLSFLIPKKSKIGKEYQLAVADGDKTFFSNSFKVKRKVSLGWIIVPAIAVTGYFIFDKIQESNAPLPGPPGSGLPDGN